MILKPSPVSLRHFTRVAGLRSGGGMLVAEVSDFGRGFAFERVYDDACDEGLTVVSHHTGREVVYGVEHVERDPEGDLLFWKLRPASPRERDLPTITIFND